MGSEVHRLEGHPGRAALRDAPDWFDSADFRLLAESLPHQVWVCGPSGTLGYMNRLGLDYFGAGQYEAAGLFAAGTAAHPDDREPSRCAWEQAVRNKEALDLQMRLRRFDGVYRWHSIHAQPVRNAEGRVTGWLGSATNVHDVRERDNEVNQRKDQFLAMLGHELRNPLAPIRNAVQILRAHTPARPDVEWARAVIERQTSHLVRLVDDLLDVSRIARGQIILQTAPLELTQLIQHAVETSRPLISARRHRLSVKLPPGPVRIEGDLTRLAQALANLLNNAAKYTDEGGEIWLDAQLEAGQLVVRVSDTGPGLAPELLPHVFELFSQAERPLDRTQGGLGIGLTLVKLLIEMHGGSVEARNSQTHPGAEFIVRLPADYGAANLGRKQAASTAGASRHPNSTPEPERPMRILVVDDNVDAADSIALLLGLDGFEARSVHSASAAFDTIGSFKPDVVLLDIGLPKMDGYEVARRLKARFPDGSMRIVALSGYGQSADRERAAQAGFDEYLVKPVEPGLLSAFLRSLRRV